MSSSLKDLRVRFNDLRKRAKEEVTDAAPAAGPEEVQPDTTPPVEAAPPIEAQAPQVALRTDKKKSRPNRTVTVQGVKYDAIQELGKGGSSVVHQVISEEGKVFAIKTVDLTDAEDMTRKSYLNEIKLLSKLQGSRYIIKLYAYELQGDYLHVVMEKGDGDLLSYLKNRRAHEKKINGYTIKFLWGEMLKCVKVIHDKNVVHSDLKPANFLFAEGGHIKLIDFGIASSIPSDKTSVVKEGIMGTLSYISPEALNDLNSTNYYDISEDENGPKSRYKVPLKSDVWSLGCILYNMVYGRTPFQKVKQQFRMHAITNPDHVIEFDDIEDKRLLDVMKKCLVRDVQKRASVDELLNHPYLREVQAEGDNTAVMPLVNILNNNQMTPRTMVRKMKEIVATSQLNMDDTS
ncbi:hypothetical protein L596_027734 [Steinernema carpocapsae]|uniref:Protein kinase domain-containing protein n=1 Tax=Steinernema carpocapsae TaxID=34508 RepID=A0A4U5LWC7_STECR|nr:hypothetical protein L596_027734 [Steinernema carpocapsae]